MELPALLFMNASGTSRRIAYMQAYLDEAMAVAYEAGGLMREAFRMGTPHTLKDDYSPVTEVDHRVNDLVIDRLSCVFPDHSFLGEEGGMTGSSAHVWVFDPIDGTVPYLRGVPTNVFAVALVENGAPVVGVVYDPYMDRLYHAVKGDGAYMNGERIHASPKTDLAKSYVAIDHHRGFTDLDFFGRLHASDVRFLSYSSTVYAHMLLAAGQMEGVVLPANKPWDAAASKVIIEEAGGIACSMRGKEQRYDGPIDGFIAACTPAYRDKLVEVLAASL